MALITACDLKGVNLHEKSHALVKSRWVQKQPNGNLSFHQ